MNFTPSQLEAVRTDRRHEDACIVAGPGSGKTTVLVEYFERLVAGGVPPSRILAITFTEKAAAQMRRKLAAKFSGDPEIRRELERSWVLTVHGFCSRLIRENAVAAGVDPQFTIAEEREFGRWQQESLNAALESFFEEHPDAIRAMIRGFGSYAFDADMLNAYDAMRGAGMNIDAVAALPAPRGVTVAEIAADLDELRRYNVTAWTPVQKSEFAEAKEVLERIVTAGGARETLRAIQDYDPAMKNIKRGTPVYALISALKKTRLNELNYTLITGIYQAERQTLLEVIRRFDRIYRERKLQSGVLDFSDLEEIAVKLLENSPATRQHLQTQFDHVLMDELQDTNGQQAALLRYVRPPGRFYAVGDLNQSIFGFRHAEPAEFQRYRDEVAAANARVVELTDNFRSRAEILRAVETVVHLAPGVVERRLVAGRDFSQDPSTWDGPRVELLQADQPPEEAAMVARRLLELLAAEPHLKFRDVAVLLRNTEVLQFFTAAFEEAGIPFVVSRGKGFYEAREVNDLVQLLRAIANPRSEISLAAVLRSPIVEASDEALLRLRLLNKNIGTALMMLNSKSDPEMDPVDVEKLTRFRDRLREWRRKREYVSFDRLLLDAMDECIYPAEPGSRAAANIDKFIAQARAASGRTSLDAFLRDLEILRKSNRPEQDAAPEDAADAVQVMTVHSAKGLEFPIVFLAAMHKGIDTKPGVVDFSPRIGLGATWRNPAERRDKSDLFHKAIREERRVRETHEANRLLYVAMTRAEHHLVMSFCTLGKRPSRWAKQVAEALTAEEMLSPYGEPFRVRLAGGDPGGPMPKIAEAAAVAAAAVVEHVASPAVSGQYDSNVTVTALRTYAKCPRLYYLAHYLGFEGKQFKGATAAATQDIAPDELGNQVHKILAGLPVPEPDPLSLRLVETFDNSALGKRLQRAARSGREVDFVMAIEDMVIRGQIDLWFEEAGELVIVDYKTDSVTPAEAAQRATDYDFQLKLYAMAAERLLGRAPDRAYLHFLKPNVIQEVDLSPSLLDSPDQLVRDFIASQETLDFPLHVTPQCRRCPFFGDACPA